VHEIVAAAALLAQPDDPRVHVALGELVPEVLGGGDERLR